MNLAENQTIATHLNVRRTSLEYLLGEIRCARRLQDRDYNETYKAIRNAIDELADILGYDAEELADEDEDSMRPEDGSSGRVSPLSLAEYIAIRLERE